MTAVYPLDFGRQSGLGTRAFLAVRAKLEPPGFKAYLGTDWRVALVPFGLQVTEARPYSFSNLIIARENKK